MREVWQEVDCIQGDHDRFDDDLLYEGQLFYCHMCGGDHVASDKLVHTYLKINGEMSYPWLPKTPQELQQLIR